MKNRINITTREIRIDRMRPAQMPNHRRDLETGARVVVSLAAIQGAESNCPENFDPEPYARALSDYSDNRRGVNKGRKVSRAQSQKAAVESISDRMTFGYANISKSKLKKMLYMK